MNRKRNDFGTQKLRTAIYARKSAEDERQTSIDTQITSCKDFIKQYDFLELTETFYEDNRSGMFTDNRTQYNKMLEKAERQEIDVIVVMKLDRLARDVSDATTAIKLINIYNCYLIAGDDVANSQTPSGEFVRNILMAQNQYHARRSASDVMLSECNNARKGDSAGGIPPYGLKVLNKKYYINEDEAPAVRLMFKGIAQGKSYQQVIDELTKQGYKTRNGVKFSYSTLSTLLRNEKYYGLYIYNKTGGKKKAHRVLIEHFDEVRNNTAIKPLIPKKLFDEVQTILNKRKNECRAHSNRNPQYILTGLIYCKDCGKSMSGQSFTGGSNKKHYRTYVCPNHSARYGKTCATKAINAEYLENAIKAMLTECINDYLRTSSLGESVFDNLIKDKQSLIGRYSRNISELEMSANKMLERSIATSSKQLAEQYERKADEFLTEKGKSEAEIKTLTSEIKTLESLVASFKSHTATLTTDEIFYSDEVARTLVQLFINRIEVDDASDNIEIVFNT